MIRRVKKEQWLQGALDFVVEQGIVGMTPERLATALGTSRSSFYWHFHDQDNFRSQVIGYWAKSYTEDLRDKLIAFDGAPADRLELLFELVQPEQAARYDDAVQALAYGSPALMEKIDRMYKVRVDYVRSILSELGVRHDELGVKTRLLVSYLASGRKMGEGRAVDSASKDHEFLISLLR